VRCTAIAFTVDALRRMLQAKQSQPDAYGDSQQPWLPDDSSKWKDIAAPADLRTDRVIPSPLGTTICPDEDG
jgi:hypothetical protein